jgi:hypothetical protein
MEYARIDYETSKVMELWSSDTRTPEEMFGISQTSTWVDVSNLASVQQNDIASLAGSTWSFTRPVYIPVKTTRLTKLALKARFTDEEWAAIRNASRTDDLVYEWLIEALAATYVDLSDPRTLSGFSLLVAKNLITRDRATQILIP